MTLSDVIVRIVSYSDAGIKSPSPFVHFPFSFINENQELNQPVDEKTSFRALGKFTFLMAQYSFIQRAMKSSTSSAGSCSNGVIRLKSGSCFVSVLGDVKGAQANQERPYPLLLAFDFRFGALHAFRQSSRNVALTGVRSPCNNN